MFVVSAIALLCLVSVSHSAPLVCEDLVRPLDHVDPHYLEERRALVAVSLCPLPDLEEFKQRDSATIHFSNNTLHYTTRDSIVTCPRSMHLDHQCSHNTYKISLDGSNFTFVGTDKRNLSANFAHTSCHDCMLMHMYEEITTRHHLYLFSRRRQLEQREMEEFRAQVECLNLPPPVEMDPNKELCPEETASDPAEEKTEEQKG